MKDIKSQAQSIHIITARGYRDLRKVVRRKLAQGWARHDLPLECGEWLVQMMLEGGHCEMCGEQVKLIQFPYIAVCRDCLDYAAETGKGGGYEH